MRWSLRSLNPSSTVKRWSQISALRAWKVRNLESDFLAFPFNSVQIFKLALSPVPTFDPQWCYISCKYWPVNQDRLVYITIHASPLDSPLMHFPISVSLVWQLCWQMSLPCISVLLWGFSVAKQHLLNTNLCVFSKISSDSSYISKSLSWSVYFL